MDFEKLADKAKQVAEQANEVVEQRGGAEALKEDAEELRDIARGDGGLVDKAKDAAEAVRDPGAPGQG
jgi:general stress protein YciG